jgi:hypothetical protein
MDRAAMEMSTAAGRRMVGWVEDRPPLADALLTAPGGTALLARLEVDHRPDRRPFWLPSDSDPTAVDRAVESLATLSFGEFVAVAAEGLESVGPWMPDAADNAANAYLGADARRPIAEAIAERFGALLEAPIDLERQEHWDAAWNGRAAWRDRFDGGIGVYCCGEFTFDAIWTVTALPAEAHGALVSAWEMYCDELTRHRLPVRDGARLWEIHRSEEWVDLVRAYPRSPDRPHGGWELPGPNQHLEDLDALRAVPAQRAAVTGEPVSQLVPDWDAVAADFDGVHLSWAGFLTSEGFVSRLADAEVTMLRYWFSERTLWLRDVFGDPEPLPAPAIAP